MTPKPARAKARHKVIRGDVYRFLLGEGPLDGHEFGEMHKTFPGRYWWRAFLRTKPDGVDPTPAAARKLIKAALDFALTDSMDYTANYKFRCAIKTYRKSTAAKKTKKGAKP